MLHLQERDSIKSEFTYLEKDVGEGHVGTFNDLMVTTFDDCTTLHL